MDQENEHEHGHGGGHGHGGRHEHPSAPKSFSAAFATGILLNLGLVVVEIVYGVASHSMTLVADAVHNLGDVLGLGMSWAAAAVALAKPPTAGLMAFAGPQS